MVDFNKFLDSIVAAEQKGFDATKDSYFNYYAEGEPEATPMTDTDVVNLYDSMKKDQALLTKAFQKKYSNVPVSDILTGMDGNTYSRVNTNELSQPYKTKYGDVYLTPEEVKAIAPNYYANKSAYESYLGSKGGVKKSVTKGEKEKQQTEEGFGFSNIISQYNRYIEKEGKKEKVGKTYLYTDTEYMKQYE
jgi:hypothetical protein